MSRPTCTIEFSAEEIAALGAWLQVIAFEGTAAVLAKPLALHASILAKLQAARTDDATALPVQSDEHSGAHRDDTALT